MAALLVDIERCIVGFVESFVSSCGKVESQVKEIHHLEICRNCDIYASGLDRSELEQQV